jgi:thiol-disulfide isomerase/thioredoxin
MKLLLSSFALCCLLGLIGCNSQLTPAKSDQAAAEKKAPKEEAKPAKEVDLKVVNLAELTDAIKAHKGKIVVVDAWATWCIPCKTEFPHLVELHNKYELQGVVCISVSVDDLKSKDKALKFLKQEKATFANYLFQGKSDDELNNAWVFSGVPVVRVYQPSGELAKQFSNADTNDQFTYKDVEALVQKMVKK